mmetsp:Transcript_63558/g.151929  ORF Transcript_63558/g.151929 Transcript_63558/m.151929 type:complete len:89 (+) Transcript_63558:418-684(+)
MPGILAVLRTTCFVRKELLLGALWMLARVTVVVPWYAHEQMEGMYCMEQPHGDMVALKPSIRVFGRALLPSFHGSMITPACSLEEILL